MRGGKRLRNPFSLTPIEKRLIEIYLVTSSSPHAPPTPTPNYKGDVGFLSCDSWESNSDCRQIHLVTLNPCNCVQNILFYHCFFYLLNKLKREATPLTMTENNIALVHVLNRNSKANGKLHILRRILSQ